VPPYPEEPDYYSEPTAAARYRAYSEAGNDAENFESAPEPPTPWYRRPAALIAAGAIGVMLLAALVFAVVKLATGSPAHSPATTTQSTTAPATTTAEAPRHHGGGGAPTETVTETAPPSSTDTATTSVAPSTTAASPSTDTSTVTQTVTVPPRRPFQPRP